MSIERRRNAGNQNTDKSWLIIYTCENKIAASRSRSLRSKRASGVHSVNKQLSAGSSFVDSSKPSFVSRISRNQWSKRRWTRYTVRKGIEKKMEMGNKGESEDGSLIIARHRAERKRIRKLRELCSTILAHGQTTNLLAPEIHVDSLPRHF